MLHDECKEAFEIVTLPFRKPPCAIELMVSSSQPQSHPVLSPLASLGAELVALNQVLPRAPDSDVFVLDLRQAQHIYVAVPIVNDGVRLGTLIASAVTLPESLWITLLVLACSAHHSHWGSA
jgi:hypothetical protein